jgi:SpoVK/Ycf46/Vps4 family AAA+-type ATPase
MDLYSEWISVMLNTTTTTHSEESLNCNIYDLKVKLVKKEKGKDDENLKSSSIDDYTSEISKELVGTTWKDIDTLYLKENQSTLLIEKLGMFKYQKSMYTSLGIPYKLGILLYGPPGTGKSSCISAIATFLKRDVYYLDLSSVQTNEDLKMLFNHVNKSMTNNGIIVMEDIDAMTDIVHDRSNKKKTKNQKLTLECLLNLLQGSLTVDGSIFITTTNHIQNLDPALYREGRFDLKMNLDICDVYQLQTIYFKFFKRYIPDTLVELIQNDMTPAKFISHLLLFFHLSNASDDDILKDIINYSVDSTSSITTSSGISSYIISSEIVSSGLDVGVPVTREM